jgi:hypothetical protein
MWVWITQHTQPSKPPFNWQDREQVTPEMMEFICAAWKNYDGSDAHDTPISHEEAVLAKHAVETAQRHGTSCEHGA